MQILIVDGDFAVGQLLAESLRRQGHEVILARSGQEGLALVDQRYPDAVFIEIARPVEGGMDLLYQLRQDHPALPVIVITGYASADQLEEARRLGVIDVIRKPRVLRRLSRALESLPAESLGTRVPSLPWTAEE